jgi:hypothetical protein
MGSDKNDCQAHEHIVAVRLKDNRRLLENSRSQRGQRVYLPNDVHLTAQLLPQHDKKGRRE